MDERQAPHIPQVSYDAPITDLIINLEKLRYKVLEGSTHPLVFLQFKSLFHTLESIGSSRIEGNNTTVSEYIDRAKIEVGVSIQKENIREIENIEKATEYVETAIADRPINRILVCELHRLVVDGLLIEGDVHAGCYRQNNVTISGSTHIPPDYTQVEALMEGLFDFINQEHAAKYDLLKIAVAHHWFVWIHPFGNGNGRVVRLFTYALLLKNVFNNRSQRIINPTAVFCSDRDKYYYNLSQADTLQDEGLLLWCEYVLNGLFVEIEKIDKLIDYNYLKDIILMPALFDALANKYITEQEYLILKTTIYNPNQEMQAADIKRAFAGKKNSSEVSRMIKALLDKKMLVPTKPQGRKYIISFKNNYILRSVVKALGDHDFLPMKD